MIGKNLELELELTYFSIIVVLQSMFGKNFAF